MLDFDLIQLLVCHKLFIRTRYVNLINFIENSDRNFLAFSELPINSRTTQRTFFTPILMVQFHWGFFYLQIYLHGRNLSSLHAFISPEILPAEYGGKKSRFDNKAWRLSLLANEDKFVGKCHYTMSHSKPQVLTFKQPPRRRVFLKSCKSWSAYKYPLFRATRKMFITKLTKTQSS